MPKKPRPASGLRHRTGPDSAYPPSPARWSLARATGSACAGALLLLLGAVLTLWHPTPARAETWKLGALYAASGPSAPGQSLSLAGARLAVQELNDAGGVRGRPLELMLFDNLSTPIGAKQAVEQADKAGVLAVLGPSWSSQALAAAREAQARRLPLLTEIATNPSVTLAGDYIFRMCYTDIFQGQVLAHLAYNVLGLRSSINFVDVGSDYSLGLETAFASRFTELGGTVTARLPYKAMDLHRKDTLAPLVAQAAASEADLFFIPGNEESGRIIRELRRSGFQAPALGGDGWEGIPAAELAEEIGQGIYQCVHWSPDWDNPVSQALVRRFGQEQTLTSGLVLAYDAVYLLADALQRAETPDREALRKALAQTEDFTGATGPVRFDANGDPQKGAVILEVTAQGLRPFMTFNPAETLP